MKIRLAIGLFLSIIMFVSGNSDNKVLTKNNDETYVVNTTFLCNEKGFNGTTPLLVYIKSGKIKKIEVLENQESPGFFIRIKEYLLPLYDGLNIKEAKEISSKTSIDGCSGATYSYKAVQKNIKVALEYYEQHK